MKNKEYFQVCGISCALYGSENPEYLLIQPVDERDLGNLDDQVNLIETMVQEPFALVAFAVEDWNRELSPWKAPAVFGNEDFGDGAEETLSFIENNLLPFISERYGSLPVIMGGYSLAGLFALWSAFNSSSFCAVSGVSASVWFPGWLDYVSANECRASHVYLSLGDREEITRNRVMATVGDCMRAMDGILSGKGTDHVLQWNEGNHFRDVELRCAKAFAWCIISIRG